MHHPLFPFSSHMDFPFLHICSHMDLSFPSHMLTYGSFLSFTYVHIWIFPAFGCQSVHRDVSTFGSFLLALAINSADFFAINHHYSSSLSLTRLPFHLFWLVPWSHLVSCQWTRSHISFFCLPSNNFFVILKELITDSRRFDKDSHLTTLA